MADEGRSAACATASRSLTRAAAARRMYYVQEACRLLFFLLTWRTLLNRSETARALWSSLLAMLRSLVPAIAAPLTS